MWQYFYLSKRINDERKKFCFNELITEPLTEKKGTQNQSILFKFDFHLIW